jgi:hypothetical protein
MASLAKADMMMTFEEFVGYDYALISTFYSGITFEAASSGQDWIASDVTTGNYNASSWPLVQKWNNGQYWMFDYACAWTGVPGDNGKISFDNQDATFVEMGYSAYDNSGGTAIYLEAYDSSNILLDSDYDVSNLRYANNNPNGPGTLRVDAPIGQYISYLLIHDTGNLWIVDNIRTDATGITIIPAPAAVVLGILGLGVAGLKLRKYA